MHSAPNMESLDTGKCNMLYGREYIGANAHQKLIITRLHSVLARSMFKKRTKTASNSRYCGYVLMHRRNQRKRVLFLKNSKTIFDFVWNFKWLQMQTFFSLLASNALSFKQTRNALNEILIIIQAGECVNI